MVLKVDVLLPNTSLYNVLHHFTKKIFESFQRAGCRCRLLEGDERYTLPLESPPDFTIGFNGALKIDNNQLFCDYIKVPHISCLVDPPFRFIELTTSTNIILTCDDEYCCEDFRTHFFPNTFFMPHAVEKEFALQDEVEKVYDIVMLSTFIDCESRRKEWETKFPLDICQKMEQAAEITLSDETTSFISALKQLLGEYPQDISLLQSIFSEVELYIKGRDKLDLLRSITDYPVHVFGSSIDHRDWKEFSSNSNIVVHPPVSFLEALEIMKRSKILLNSSIKNKRGAHERIFSGSAAGAIVVTNDNTYMRQHFIDNQEVLLYRRTAFKELNDRVIHLLNDDARRSEMSKQARAKILAHHTWDHRITQLLVDIKSNISQ